MDNKSVINLIVLHFDKRIVRPFDMIQRFVLPVDSKSMNYDAAVKGRKRRLGSMKGQKFIADGHDIDECNDEIARLFEVDD